MWWRIFYKNWNRSDTVIFAKYMILFWTPHMHQWERAPFEKGQDALYKANCEFKNCFFTSNMNLFSKKILKLKGFDAIIFNGVSRNDEWSYIRNLPKERYSHQKYVYLSSESADHYPLCSHEFDNFFNWTYTYKLNSDNVIHYIRIQTKDGEILYPENNIQWVDVKEDVSRKFKRRLRRKTKAVAWFVSHCKTYSNRHEVYNVLRDELLRHNLTIDVYGKCGNLQCSTLSNYRDCYEMLERDYYFYLAFENSVCDDYITEKVLHALLNKVVPVVYGGANYSKFLPPGSYLDNGTLSIKEIAQKIKNAIMNPKIYASYFRWTNYYKYLNNGSRVAYSDVDYNICSFCKLMNDPERFGRYSTYTHMRSWWHPNYKKRCLQHY